MEDKHLDYTRLPKKYQKSRHAATWYSAGWRDGIEGRPLDMEYVDALFHRQGATPATAYQEGWKLGEKDRSKTPA